MLKKKDGSFFGGRCHVALFPNIFFTLCGSLHFRVHIFPKEKQIEMK